MDPLGAVCSMTIQTNPIRSVWLILRVLSKKKLRKICGKFNFFCGILNPTILAFRIYVQMMIIPSPSLRNEVETVRWCNKLNVAFALFQGGGLAIQVACLLPVSLGSQLSHYHLDKTEPAMPHISSWPSWCHDDDDSNGHQTIITIKIKQSLTHAAQTKHTLSSVRCKDVNDKDKGS